MPELMTLHRFSEEYPEILKQVQLRIKHCLDSRQLDPEAEAGIPSIMDQISLHISNVENLRAESNSETNETTILGEFNFILSLANEIMAAASSPEMTLSGNSRSGWQIA